ncbi:MAG: hypothetical protein NVS1B1_09320 [Candidatus Limnocylindrales bacterium]
MPVQAVPTGPVAAPITVGQRPIRPVPAFGAIWVASAADGTVVRVEPATGQITAVRVADPQRLIATGCAPSSEHAYATGSFGLRACDAPSAVAAGAGALWAVANDTGSLVRIDPSTAVVTATIPLGFGAWDVVAADDAVWASDYTNNAVVRIEPRTLTVRSRIPVAAGPTDLAIGPGALWVLNSASGLVTRIDSARDFVVATIPVGDWAVAIAIWEDDVWVRGGSASGSRGLIRIDARSNTVVGTYPAGALLGREGVSSLAATASGVWVPGVSLDLVGRDGGVLSTIPQRSYAVASDGATLWLLDVFGHLAGVPLPHR